MEKKDGRKAGKNMKDDMTVLVVDDDAYILNAVAEYLSAATDFRVKTARNGREAINIIEMNAVDCCLTDLSMPEMDGLELTRKIHAHDNTIPVVVMTGYPSMENAIGTLRNGVVDFLTKPVKMNQLALIIERVMRERDLFVENMMLKEEAKKYEQLIMINKELENKTTELEKMNLILGNLDQASSSRQLFQVLADTSARITQCDEAHIFILDQENKDLPIVISSFTRDSVRAMIDPAYVQEKIVEKMVVDSLPMILNGEGKLKQIMAVPLKIKTQVFGVLISIIRTGTRHFGEKDLYYLNFLAEKASSSIENLALYENIYENLFSILYAFVEAIEAKDPYTKQHSSRVTQLALSIAKELGCSQEEMDVLNVSGNLHDIGKIGIPDAILLKPGSLTDEEYEIIKKHPVIGSNIIGHFNLWTDERKTIKHHHERWDGNGYPSRLKGEDIPFLSRVVSVADTYDALTSDRSYRNRRSEDKALHIILENSDSQFDPAIVDAFFTLYKRGHGKRFSHLIA